MTTAISELFCGAGYRAIPTDLLVKLVADQDLTPAELRVALTAARKIYGEAYLTAGGTITRGAPIAVTIFVQDTGLSVRAVNSAKASLVEKGVLERAGVSGPKGREAAVWKFDRNYYRLPDPRVVEQGCAVEQCTVEQGNPCTATHPTGARLDRHVIVDPKNTQKEKTSAPSGASGSLSSAPNGKHAEAAAMMSREYASVFPERNLRFGGQEGKALKEALDRYPDVTDEELRTSWRLFLRTTEGFHITQLGDNAAFYWARSIFTEYLEEARRRLKERAQSEWVEAQFARNQAQRERELEEREQREIALRELRLSQPVEELDEDQGSPVLTDEHIEALLRGGRDR